MAARLFIEKKLLLVYDRGKLRQNCAEGVDPMTCREAESLVIPFIHDELDDDTAEAFLEHIDGCADCREELEIYYTVEAGIRQLDNDIGSSNIKGEMEEDLRESRQRLYSVRLLRGIRYAADTLTVLSVTVMLLLQLRFWWLG